MTADGVAPPAEPPHDPWMDARVTRLEDDMGEIKATLRRLEPMIVRMDAMMPTFATKADLMGVRSELKEETASLRTDLKDEMADIKIALADKPSRTYMWGIITAMIAAFACGLAGLAIVK